MKSKDTTHRVLSVSIAILVLLGSAAAAGPKEKVLYRFKAGKDGGNPYGSLIADAAGNLYGTTGTGGSPNCSGGCGTVFRLSPPAKPGHAWKETVLYRFQGGSDAAGPMAGLISDAAGNLYGTTLSGGGNNDGAVFELMPPTGGGPWAEAVLYGFSGSDGEYPLAPLIFDPAGNLYGTTFYGGPVHMGVVFELSPPAQPGGAWTETVLHRFRNNESGMANSALLLDLSGALYGTTFAGSVFKLTPPPQGQTNWSETVLHNFGGGNDGNRPCGLLAEASGTLYGVTALGGSPANAGTVYQLTPPAGQGNWTETILYAFANANDGGVPCADLAADSSGNLYGTAYIGGGSGNGTVFKMTPPANPGDPWTETTVYQFKGGHDGANPNAGLIFSADGKVLYGTTVGGGKSVASCDGGSCGIVFQITP